MHQIRRIRAEFDAAPSKSSSSKSLPTTRTTTDGACEARLTEPESTIASYSTGRSPRPNPPKSRPPRIPSGSSNTGVSPIPKPTPTFAKTGFPLIPPEPTVVRPGSGGGEILIAVMGVTGSGKSYFCRTATGDDSIGVGDGLESCTQKPTRYQMRLSTRDGQKLVTLIDTPGFNDSTRNDATIFSQIAADLRSTYAQGRKFSGILYFHRISDIRMEGSAVKQLRMFRELCGDDSGMLKNVVLATNRWDRVESEEIGIRRQTDLANNPRYWGPLCLKGSQVKGFKGTTESALELIHLVMRNTPLPLKIQQEMVDENKPLSETGAGRFVEAEIANLRKEHEQTLATIREEMELALQKKDEEMQKLLKEESERSKREIDELRKQQEIMKAENDKSLREEFELRREEWGRIENEISHLKAGMEASGQAGVTRSKRKAGRQLEREARPKRGKAGGETKRPATGEPRKRINELTEETEQWPRVTANAQIIQGTGRPRRLAGRRPGVGSREAEQRNTDEQDLKDAGYHPLGSRYSATRALSAAVRNHQEMRVIRLLLAKGADPTLCIAQPDGVNSGALHVAADIGYVDAIRIFIEHKADLSAGDEDRSTPLCYAKSEAVIRLLLENGAQLDIVDDFGNSALIFAADGGHASAVRLLLEKGAKPDIQCKRGNTALVVAAQYGYEEVVRLLLANGAKLDMADKYGNTALILAAEGGHAGAVQLLLAKGAKRDIQSNIGSTALIEAAIKGHEEVIRQLIASGAELDIVDEGGDTALILAAEEGHVGSVRLLLEKGAKTDVQCNKGNTALMCAAYEGRGEVVRLLLANRAKFDIANKDGNTALIRAAERGNARAVHLLLAGGAKHGIQSNNGNTALIVAASNGYGGVIRELITYEAKLDIANNAGCTALSQATNKGHEGAARLLRRGGAG